MIMVRMVIAMMMMDDIDDEEEDDKKKCDHDDHVEGPQVSPCPPHPPPPTLPLAVLTPLEGLRRCPGWWMNPPCCPC
jgi:hypothetical protein